MEGVNMDLDNRIRFANLPTKIERLDKLSKELGKNIYIKRDDQTGTEISGNKIRKLEFAVKEALDQGSDCLITCGGIQSNHARATAQVAAKMGLEAYLVLRGDPASDLEGNYFLDKILGANIIFVTGDQYSKQRMEIMEDLKEDLAMKGKKAYIIPEGASNGIGSLGYINAIDEILIQEKEMGLKFDATLVAVGSGGTFAGLYYGNEILNRESTVYGINISETKDHFQNVVLGLLKEISLYTKQAINPHKDQIKILDGYPGRGYALSSQYEIDFIQDFAMKEGIILDPVYTGKAMYGLVSEIKKGTFDDHENILFIHTGGLYGWTSFARDMIK